MPVLIIRHTLDDSFSVVRAADVRETEAATVSSPAGFAVEDRPNSDLTSELQWYLEEFLDYPFPPKTEQAEHVRAALRSWGSQAFKTLFGAGQGRDFYSDAMRTGEQLELRISSDDPGVLSWPWEALHDPQRGPLGQTCQIERALNRQSDPLPISAKLPQDRVNILLVTARPYEADVQFRSISRQGDCTLSHLPNSTCAR
jgi:hypothetical protein